MAHIAPGLQNHAQAAALSGVSDFCQRHPRGQDRFMWECDHTCKGYDQWLLL